MVGELLQNASDAAAYVASQEQDGSGQVLVTLLPEPADGPDPQWVLQVSNTGKPMTAESLRSLVALRGSNKPRRETKTVGRFGVGFAAVAAVTDQPQFSGQQAGVRFDAGEARHAAGFSTETPVPLLRVPFPDSARSLPGYVTTVTLPLRDAAAVTAVAAELAAITDVTVLQYPGILCLEIRTDHPDAGGSRTISDVSDRWHLWSRTVDTTGVPTQPGTPPMPSARVAVAVPRREAGDSVADLLAGGQRELIPPVLLAPTPTGVGWAWPHLVIIAEVAVDEARRRVLPGPVTDLVLTEAAQLTAQAAAELVSGGSHTVWELLSTHPAGSKLDARFRELLAAELADVAVLPGADNGTVAPTVATALAEPDVTADAAAWLAGVIPGLVVVPTSHAAWQREWGILEGDLNDIFAAVPWPRYAEGVDGQWEWLRVLREALHRPGVRSAIGHMRVPGPDGALHPARQSVVAVDCGPDVHAGLHAANIPVVLDRVADSADGAAILRAAGATWVDYATALHLPAVQTWATTVAVQALDDEFWDDATSFPGDGTHLEGTSEPAWHTCARMVLAAVTAGAHPPTWARDVVWPDEDGEPVPATDLVQPGSRLDRWRDPEAVGALHPDWYVKAPETVWEALGVAADLAVVPLAGVDTVEIGGVLNGDGATEWGEEMAVGVIRSGAVVTGVDMVAETHWGDLVDALDTDPVLRQAVVEPVVAGDSSRHPSWTAWWLGDVLDCVGSCVGVNSVWLPPPPVEVAHASNELIAALGVVPGLAALDTDGWADVLADAETAAPTAWDVAALWDALGVACAAGNVPEPPVGVWALDHLDGPVWVAPEQVTVVDYPMWAHRTDLGPMIPYRHAARPAAKTAPDAPDPVAHPQETGDAADDAVVDAGQAGNGGIAPAADIADWLGATLASETDAATVTSTGTHADLPAAVRLIAPSAPATWTRHTALHVDDQPVPWWVTDSGSGPMIHAESERAAAVAAAWCAGVWHRRDEAAAWAAAPADQVTVALGGWVP